MQTRTIGAAVLLVMTLAISGCAGQATSEPAPSDARPSSSPTADAPDASTPSESPAAPIEGAYLEYTDGVIEATPGPKVLFFHASWCPQCRELDEQLTAEGAPDGLTVFKVDFDSRSDLRQQYGVTLQTTVVFVDDEGGLISSAVLYDDPSIESLLAAMP